LKANEPAVTLNEMNASRSRFSQTSVFLATAILVSACVLSGCLSRPALQRQTFAFTASEAVPTNILATARVLGIRNLRIAVPFEGRSLVYRTGDNAYVRDPYAEFLDTPAESLLVAIREWLRDNATFAAVVEPGSSLRPNTLAEIEVTRLYGDFRQPQRPVAVLTMRFLFFDAPETLPGKVLLERKYARYIPLKSATPAALMDGWNEALTQVLTQVISDLRNLESEESGVGAQSDLRKTP
jgi:cholesterol transport system auxiliary component